MAIASRTTGSGLTRVPTGFDPRLDWTRCVWVRYTLDPGTSGDFYTTFEIYSGAPVWDLGAYVYRDPALADALVQDIEVNTPSGDFQYTSTPIDLNTWYYLTMRHTAATQQFDLLLNGVVLGSASADMSAASATPVTEYLLAAPADVYPASLGGGQVWGDRFWQAALSVAEIQAEMAARTPVRSADLFSASSLYSPNQLTDVSGNLHHWSIVAANLRGNYLYTQGPLAPVIFTKVFTFTPRSGIGTQTLSGINDAVSGVAFDASLVLFHTGVSPADVVQGVGPSANALADNRGADTGIVGSSGGSADRTQFTTNKVASAGGGFRYSLLETLADAFFGGAIGRKGYVSNIRVGSLELTYDLNGPGNFDTILCTAFGGDLNLEPLTVAPGTIDTTGELVGLFRLSCVHALSTAKSVDNGAGGGRKGYGFATRDSGQGAMEYSVLTNSGNRRLQRTDRFYVDTGNLAQSCYVANWGADTIRYGGTTSTDPNVFGVGGAGVQVWGGQIAQPGSAGNQRVAVGFYPRWILVVSYGAADAGGTLLTDQAELGVGWSDGIHQGGFWCAESGVSGVTVNGARFITAGSLLRFCTTPNAGSTTFSAIANLAGVDDTGFTLNWSLVDGVARQILVFVIGQVLTPPIVNPGCLVALPGATTGAAGCGVALPSATTGPGGCVVPEPAEI